MLTQTIPSYLYVQYNDDLNISTFVSQYNAGAQAYLDTINALNLPNYTASPVDGGLLDWVAGGVYGFDRPTFPSINLAAIGPLNTFTPGSIAFNEFILANAGGTFYTSDDAFRRVITWHTFRADGSTFNIRWFKRRISRFIFDENGTWTRDPDTSRISVTFGPPYTVNVRIVNNVRRVVGGAIFARFVLAKKAFAQIDTTNQAFEPIPTSYVLEGAINGGILEVPFQFSYVVTQGGIAQFGPYEL